MTDHRNPRRAFAACALLAATCLLAAACSSVSLEESPPYDYATKPIAIANPDWGVIPLPNDFLNPVKQASIVRIPGVEAPAAAPTTMAIPILDRAAADKAQDLGYPIAEDDPLSKALLAGQNRLDGFMASFAPSIPFSRKVDMASLVPYQGDNAADANLFFLDVTDPAQPVPIGADGYARLFDWQMAGQMPYSLSLRLTDPEAYPPTKDFTPGHSYLVVATGWTDKGLKALPDVEGQPSVPFVSDSPFQLFAAPVTFPDDAVPVGGTTYIGPDGGPRSGVVSGLDAARELEGGRQLTDWALQVWEALPGVKDAWTRDQVVVAYSFTVATNPMPDYFDPVAAFLGGNAVRPQPSDAVDGSGALLAADASCDTTLDFTLDKEIAVASANGATVRLFRYDAAAAKKYTQVPLDVVATNAQGTASVTATPKAPLAADSLYVAAITNGITNPAGTRTAVDQTYFGLTRAAYLQADAVTGAVTFLDTPLVGQDIEFPEDPTKLTWKSKYLDSRLDTLILNGVTDTVTKEDRDAAGATLVQILSYLERMRAIYKPHIDWLVLGDDGRPGQPGEPDVDNVVAQREDLVLVWTFTTGACAQ